MKLNFLKASRWSWFAAVGVLFGARDMCAGGGGPPSDPPPPEQDSGPADAQDDATMSRAPVRATPALARLRESARARARANGPV
jgi:hypothetical protein